MIRHLIKPYPRLTFFKFNYEIKPFRSGDIMNFSLIFKHNDPNGYCCDIGELINSKHVKFFIHVNISYDSQNSQLIKSKTFHLLK